MDKKSFVIGMAIPTVIYVTVLMFINVSRDNPVTRECNLVEDGPIDTDFEQVMVNTRVDAYAHGYYECLRDNRPDIHMAYVSCVTQLDIVEGDEAFNRIVDSECAKHNLNAVDKEYLCTLLLD